MPASEVAPPECAAMIPRPAAPSARATTCPITSRSPLSHSASPMVKNTWLCTTRLASPGAMPAVDRDEQQAELADADQDAVERERAKRDRRPPQQENSRKSGEAEAQGRKQQRRQMAERHLDDDEVRPPHGDDRQREDGIARRQRSVHATANRRGSARPWSASAAPASAVPMTIAIGRGVPSWNIPATVAASAPVANATEPISAEVAPARSGSTSSAPAVVLAAMKPYEVSDANSVASTSQRSPLNAAAIIPVPLSTPTSEATAEHAV